MFFSKHSDTDVLLSTWSVKTALKEHFNWLMDGDQEWDSRTLRKNILSTHKTGMEEFLANI